MNKVPKIIHQIWSGIDEPLPQFFRLLSETWKNIILIGNIYFGIILSIKVMQKNICKNHQKLLFLTAVVFLLASCSSKEPSFEMKQKVVRIPIDYSIHEKGYFSSIVVNNDTVKMKIDTGSSSSYLSSLSTEYISRNKMVCDASGIMREIPFRRIEEINWGNLRIENLLVGNYKHHNVIGNDILGKFCVKFDNENRQILLSDDAELIEKKGIRVPFEMAPSGLPKLNLHVNGINTQFALDTGYNGELLVDSAFFHSSGLSSSERISKWTGDLSIKSAFWTESLSENNMLYVTLADCKLQEKVFKDVLVSYRKYIEDNNIGSMFLRRFKSVVIDYLNQEMYFELPQDICLTEDIKMIFSNEEVTTSSLESLNDLFLMYNSLGFIFDYNSMPLTVYALEVNSNEELLTAGDTLIGINQTLFSYPQLKQNIERNGYYIERDEIKMRKMLRSIMNQATGATFHFLKNGDIVTVNKERKKMVDPPPILGYAFHYKQEDLLLYYGEMNFYIDYEAKKMSVHFPWSSLSGREIELTGHQGGDEEFILSNKN